MACALVPCDTPQRQRTFVLLSGYNIMDTANKQNKGPLSVWRVTGEPGHTPQGSSLWIQGLKISPFNLTWCVAVFELRKNKRLSYGQPGYNFWLSVQVSGYPYLAAVEFHIWEVKLRRSNSHLCYSKLASHLQFYHR